MECRFIFPTGKRCRCRATPSHVFCRHHAPQPRPRTLRPPTAGFHPLIDVRRNLAVVTPQQIPAAILCILSALLEDGSHGISDVHAGTLLRSLLRRNGSVPFILPGDPAPQPDFAQQFSESLDRVAAIIERHTAAISQSNMLRPAR